jgi:hypothetical protein
MRAYFSTRLMKRWASKTKKDFKNLLEDIGLLFTDRLSLAQSPNCPARLLEKLANDDKTWSVRCRVSRNPNCPIHLLEKLADYKVGFVRYGIAQNPNCPVHLLEKLADDKDWWVRYDVALNPNCPQYLKEYIEVKAFIDCYGNEF